MPPMSLEVAGIQALPDVVCRKLRSGVVVNSLAQVAEELICNSIDAGSKKISVTLETDSLWLTVEDDGHGMSREDLILLGSQRASSKLSSLEELEAGPQLLGFRGEAFHAITNFALVDVVTRRSGSVHTYRKICKGGEVLSQGLSASTRSPGTTVIVKDVFFNQPVRRQQLVSRLSKETVAVKERLVRLAMIRPSIEFHFQVSPTGFSVHLDPVSSTTDRCQQLTGVPRQLRKVDVKRGTIRVCGYISKLSDAPGEGRDTCQYIYVNDRYVSGTPIHKAIKQRFSATSRVQTAPTTKTAATAPPAFILNIQCPCSEYDVTLNPEKTYIEFKDWKSVLTPVEKALDAVWGPCAELLSSQETRLNKPLDAALHLSLEVGDSSTHWQDVLPVHPRDTRHVQRGMGLPTHKDGSFLPDGDSRAAKRRRALESLLESPMQARPSPGHLLRPQSVQQPLGRECNLTRPSPDEELWVERCGRSGLRDDRSPGARREGLFDLPFNKSMHLMPRRMPLTSGGCGRAGIAEELSQWLQELSEPGVNPGRTQGLSAKAGGSTGKEGAGSKGWSGLQPCGSLQDQSSSRGGGGTTSKLTQEVRLHQPAQRTSRTSSFLMEEAQLPWLAPNPQRQRMGFESAGTAVGEREIGGSIVPVTGPKCSKAPLDDDPRKQRSVASTRAERRDEGQLLLTYPTTDATGGDQRADVPCCCHAALEPATACEANMDPSISCNPSLAPSSDVWECPDKPISVRSIYDTWCQSRQERSAKEVPDILSICSKTGFLEGAAGLVSCTSPVVPPNISKDVLREARCLRQIDNKFVVAMSGHTLLLVDQHAADERILLEELRNEVLNSKHPQSCELLESPVELKLGPKEADALEACRKKVEWWGWRFKVAPSVTSAREHVRNLREETGPEMWAESIIVCAVPKILGTSLAAGHLDEFARQLLDTQASSDVPPAVVRLLNSKACRGAIMFGDKLLPSQCGQLLEQLKKTQLSFQCAHGRPTMVPIVDLQHLRNGLPAVERSQKSLPIGRPVTSQEAHDSVDDRKAAALSLSKLKARLEAALSD